MDLSPESRQRGRGALPPARPGRLGMRTCSALTGHLPVRAGTSGAPTRRPSPRCACRVCMVSCWKAAPRPPGPGAPRICPHPRVLLRLRHVPRAPGPGSPLLRCAACRSLPVQPLTPSHRCGRLLGVLGVPASCGHPLSSGSRCLGLALTQSSSSVFSNFTIAASHVLENPSGPCGREDLSRVQPQRLSGSLS